MEHEKGKNATDKDGAKRPPKPGPGAAQKDAKTGPKEHLDRDDRGEHDERSDREAIGRPVQLDRE